MKVRTAASHGAELLKFLLSFCPGGELSFHLDQLFFPSPASYEGGGPLAGPGVLQHTAKSHGCAGTGAKGIPPEEMGGAGGGGFGVHIPVSEWPSYHSPVGRGKVTERVGKLRHLNLII